MKKWGFVLSFVAVFVAGAISGIALDVGHLHRFMGPPRRSEMKNHVMDRLKAELALTPDQVTKIAPVVDSMGAQLDAIHQESAAKVLHVFEEANAQIARELTAEQQTKLQEMQQHRRERLLMGPPPPHPRH